MMPYTDDEGRVSQFPSLAHQVRAVSLNLTVSIIPLPAEVAR